MTSLHVGIDRDAVYRRRVGDRLTVLGGHLDPCTGRFLGVEGCLLDRVAAAGAAGQVGEKHAVAVARGLDDRDVVTKRHASAPQPQASLPLDLAQRADGYVLARVLDHNRSGLLRVTEDVVAAADAIELPARLAERPDHRRTVHDRVMPCRACPGQSRRRFA